MGNAEFSRGVALTRGAATLAPDALMFFTDVDMLFTCDALDRIRLNTVHDAQVGRGRGGIRVCVWVESACESK